MTVGPAHAGKSLTLSGPPLTTQNARRKSTKKIETDVVREFDVVGRANKDVVMRSMSL